MENTSLLQKIAYFIYCYDIKSLNVENTFFSIANKITIEAYTNIAKNILEAYEEENNDIMISNILCDLDNKSHKTNIKVNQAHIKQANDIIHYINNLKQIYDSTVVYIDLNEYFNNLEKYTGYCSRLLNDYSNIEFYGFDEELHGSYSNFNDFIKCMHSTSIGKNGLNVTKNIISRLSYEKSINCIILSDFCMIENKIYFNEYMSQLLDVYNSKITTIDTNSI